MSQIDTSALTPSTALGRVSFRGLFRRFGRANYLTVASFIILALLILTALVGPFFLGDPNAQSVQSFRPPVGFGGTWTHTLGTDELGRDELVRTVNALRTSLFLATSATILGGICGVAMGVVAGYIGGIVDELLMRLVDVFLAVPGIIIVLLVVSVLRPSTISIVGMLALLAWLDFARVARSQVLSLRDQDMVIAERSLGASRSRVMLRHIVPNVAGPLLVLGTLEISNLIIVDAALGFLGLGIPPPTPTLGGMIASGQDGLTSGYWWLVCVPGAVLTLSIICINVLGDALRDRLDPKLNAVRHQVRTSAVE